MLITSRLFWLKNHSLSRKRARHRNAPLLLGGVRDWLLEDRCLLSSGTPVQLPTPTVASLDKVFYDGVSGQYVKTITFTNNSPTQTIYPFLEGHDDRQAISPY